AVTGALMTSDESPECSAYRKNSHALWGHTQRARDASYRRSPCPGTGHVRVLGFPTSRREAMNRRFFSGLGTSLSFSTKSGRCLTTGPRAFFTSEHRPPDHHEHGDDGPQTDERHGRGDCGGCRRDAL